jgi:hypothetical protein
MFPRERHLTTILQDIRGVASAVLQKCGAGAAINSIWIWLSLDNQWVKAIQVSPCFCTKRSRPHITLRQMSVIGSVPTSSAPCCFPFYNRLAGVREQCCKINQHTPQSVPPVHLSHFLLKQVSAGQCRLCRGRCIGSIWTFLRFSAHHGAAVVKWPPGSRI